MKLRNIIGLTAMVVVSIKMNFSLIQAQAKISVVKDFSISLMQALQRIPM